MMISVRGHEFNYPLYDIDAMARNEASDAALKAALEAVGSYEGFPTLEQQEDILSAYAAYFDVVLGEGTLEKLLGGKRNAMDAIEAYYDVRDAVLDAMIQRANAVARRGQVPEKYDPEKVRK